MIIKFKGKKYKITFKDNFYALVCCLMVGVLTLIILNGIDYELTLMGW